MGLKKKYHIDVEKIEGEGKEIKEKWKKNQAIKPLDILKHSNAY